MIDYDKIHDDIIIINNNGDPSIFPRKENHFLPKKKFQPTVEQSTHKYINIQNTINTHNTKNNPHIFNVTAN